MKKLILTGLIILSFASSSFGQFIGINMGIPGSNQVSTLQRLASFGGMTFYKNYANSPASLNADFSVGSSTATFTATRSASAPATYVDSNGVIQLTTTSNVGRFQGGYYDTNGFNSQKGLMIEAAGTNLLTRTDGTATSSGLWTGWSATAFGNITGTPVTTNNAIPQLTSIIGATSQRVQYTGVAGDTPSKNLYLSDAGTANASVAPSNVVTISLLAKSTTGMVGVTTVALTIDWRDNTDSQLSVTNIDIKSSLSSSYRKFTLTGTAPASTDHIKFYIQTSGIDNGDSVDLEIYGDQAEINPYATSWIPTTTTSLTRGAEVLKYPISGNRTAASESIFIKFSPESTWANDGIARVITSTDTKNRDLLKTTAGTRVKVEANANDSPAVVVTASTTTPAVNTSYITATTIQHSSPFITVYMNGSSEGTYTVGDFIDPAWGTSFYIGCLSSGIQQINGIIQSVTIYNNALSVGSVLQASNIMKSN